MDDADATASDVWQGEAKHEDDNLKESRSHLISDSVTSIRCLRFQARCVSLEMPAPTAALAI